MKKSLMALAVCFVILACAPGSAQAAVKTVQRNWIGSTKIVLWDPSISVKTVNFSLSGTDIWRLDTLTHQISVDRSFSYRASEYGPFFVSVGDELVVRPLGATKDVSYYSRHYFRNWLGQNYSAVQDGVAFYSGHYAYDWIKGHRWAMVITGCPPYNSGAITYEQSLTPNPWGSTRPYAYR